MPPHAGTQPNTSPPEIPGSTSLLEKGERGELFHVAADRMSARRGQCSVAPHAGGPNGLILEQLGNWKVPEVRHRPIGLVRF